MRLFVAVCPPAEAVSHLGAQIVRLRVGAAAAAGFVRLADPADLHLTLAFLGDVEAARLVGVESALGLAADSFRAGREAPPRLSLGGGGVFGDGRRTVLWVDARGDVEPLHELARLVRERLHEAGLPYDEKPFRPHLTVARPGDRMELADVEADLVTLDEYAGPEWPATELLLVRSHLRAGRPRYERLAAIRSRRLTRSPWLVSPRPQQRWVKIWTGPAGMCTSTPPACWRRTFIPSGVIGMSAAAAANTGPGSS
jgi:2'-5' RNA ligase